jgi:hypothetical protein
MGSWILRHFFGERQLPGSLMGIPNLDVGARVRVN